MHGVNIHSRGRGTYSCSCPRCREHPHSYWSLPLLYIVVFCLMLCFFVCVFLSFGIGCSFVRSILETLDWVIVVLNIFISQIGSGIAGTVASTGETMNIPDAYQGSTVCGRLVKRLRNIVELHLQQTTDLSSPLMLRAGIELALCSPLQVWCVFVSMCIFYDLVRACVCMYVCVYVRMRACVYVCADLFS
jgi:hypothetical protein